MSPISAHGERTLMRHLLDADALALLSREGLPEECIPSEELRPIVAWAVDYYFRSGRAQAPSVEALRSQGMGTTTFGGILDDHEIEIDEDPTDSIEWALDDLRNDYIHKQGQTFAKEFVTEMASCGADEREGVLNVHASELVTLSLSLVRKDKAVDVREGAADIVQEYEGREANRDVFRGMRLGWPEIDQHTYGIHEGEIAVFAAGPKTGKSYVLAIAALAEYDAGRVPGLFTLENNVSLTLDRIACLAVGVNSTRWQRGICLPHEVEAIRQWQEDMRKSDHPLWVLQPDLGRRSIESMVREAQVRGCDSILIDQLTFVELPSPRKPKPERIGEAMHILAGLLTTGRQSMPCLLAHQINREGVKAADKLGHLEMYHLAEAAEIERTASWVFGGYASRDAQEAHQMLWQVLGSRRAGLNSWDIHWQPEDAIWRVRNPIVL